MNIGEKIKSARLSKGYTQEELGKLIGVQKSAVAKYEKGRVVNIKRSVLAKIAHVLEISPVELVGDIEENPVKTDNQSHDLFLNFKSTETDEDFILMVEEYNQLPELKKSQVREYVHLLYGKKD